MLPSWNVINRCRSLSCKLENKKLNKIFHTRFKYLLIWQLLQFPSVYVHDLIDRFFTHEISVGFRCFYLCNVKWKVQSVIPNVFCNSLEFAIARWWVETTYKKKDNSLKCVSLTRLEISVVFFPLIDFRLNKFCKLNKTFQLVSLAENSYLIWYLISDISYNSHLFIRC